MTPKAAWVKPLAAYLYLRRRGEGHRAKMLEVGNGMLLEFSTADRSLGVERSTSSRFDLRLRNEALAAYGVPPVGENEVRPSAR
ncbi:MAG: hypothetical protein JNM84_12355 [Planctomycetes bacterium]|nr:hypothetical protein [Planctomycetota bacterium]